MISKHAGILLKANTKTKIWWMKLAVAIVISNIFFFLLFSGNETAATEEITLPQGLVEIQIKGELHTTFQKGKKVLLVNRSYGKKVEAVLQEVSSEDGKQIVLVQEEEASVFFHFENWEIFPFVKSLHLVTKKQETSHEIRY